MSEQASISAAVPADHPMMVAWKAYQETDAFMNSLIWATALNYSEAGAHRASDPDAPFSGIQREQNAKGSLWAAFVEGWLAAGGKKPFAP